MDIYEDGQFSLTAKFVTVFYPVILVLARHFTLEWSFKKNMQIAVS